MCASASNRAYVCLVEQSSREGEKERETCRCTQECASAHTEKNASADPGLALSDTAEEDRGLES